MTEPVAGRAPVLAAALARRSISKVTDAAPGRNELLPLIAAAARLADHDALRPWRVIALRGERRAELGAALVEAAGAEGGAAEKLAEKPLRAPLLLAIVHIERPSLKVPSWEQEAVAAGVGHLLSLLLAEAGWGVIWRTGIHTRSEPVRRVHRLHPAERLLGWLYVGGLPEQLAERPPAAKRPREAEELLEEL